MTVTDAAPAERLSPWAPLRHAVFRSLFIAQLVSSIGTLMQSVGSAWVMGDLDASPTLVASVQTASFLPLFLLGIPAGALADIADRRRLLMSTHAALVIFAGTLSALAFLDALSPFNLLALTFILGICGALGSPAWQAIQPDLVPPKEFGQALALGSLTFNLGRAVGPALGGLLLAAAGPAWVFAVNAASFLGILLVLLRWHPTWPEVRLPAETLAGATRAALRYGLHAPILGTILLRLALLLVPAAALNALLPIVVRGQLGLGSGAYGLLLGAFGVGAALAAVVRPRLDERLSFDAMVVWSSVILGGALLIQGFVEIPVVVGVALLIAGFAWTTALTTLNIAAQATLAGWVRARGMGLYMLVLTGSIALGSLFWGAVADWSVPGAHAVAAGMIAAGVVVSRRHPMEVVSRIDVSPVPGTDPMVVLTPAHHDGPVMVTIAYRVDAAEMPGFVQGMRAVEQHRRRTGAYRWGLFRDLADPERFVETFVVDSWVEHLRQHHRVTASIDAHLQALYAYLDGAVSVSHYISAYSHGALADPDVVERSVVPSIDNGASDADIVQR